MTKSTVPTGHGRADRGDPEEEREAQVLGRLEPRVPPRGLGDRGLHAPGPRRDRLARRGGHRDREGRLLAARDRRRPVRRDRRRVRRAHQVRLERVPRAQDHVHQRDRGAVRPDGRRRQGRRTRDGPRQAHRAAVPEPGPRLRRLVLPEGLVGRRGPRAQGRLHVRAHGGDALRERPRQGPHDREGRGALRKRLRASASRSSASPSSPRPTTSARARASGSRPTSSRAARTSSPTTPPPWRTRRRRCPR